MRRGTMSPSMRFYGDCVSEVFEAEMGESRTY